jgi:hypothetical protein
MRTIVGSAVLAALLGAGPTAQAAAAVDQAPSPTANAVTGTIEHVDAAAKVLTLKTAKGSETFSLADNTRIHHGAKIASIGELSAWNGQLAKVRYTEANGGKTATSIMVGGAHRAAHQTAGVVSTPR